MNLDDLMRKVINEYGIKKDRKISFAAIQLLLSLGTRIVLIYLFFIFVVGKYVARFLGYNNLYFLSIIIATLVNIVIIFEIVRSLRKTDK